MRRPAAVVTAPMAITDVGFTDVPAQLPPLEQQRPSFLVLGAQKAGTTALAIHLNKHPQIYNSIKKVKELHFFDRTLSRSARRGSINVTEGRQQYAEHFRHVDYSQNTNRAFEATPAYLLYTHTTLPRIVHVCPWAKFVAVLRHPVARAYSQYKMIVARKNPSIPANTTFAAWVQEDFAKMQAAGLVEPNGEGSSFVPALKARTNPQEEDAAWDRYVRTISRDHGPVGRGLYALQLRQWFAAFDENEYPRDEKFLILLYEDFLREPNENGMDGLERAVRRTWEFVNVSTTTMEGTQKSQKQRQQQQKKKAVATKKEDMDPVTSSLLESFYRPYNRQLEAMLGQEWRGVWE